MYGQRIHIGAQANAATRAIAPMDQPDDARAPDTGFHRIAADLAQEIRDRGTGAVAVEQNFGMGMKILPQSSDLGQKSLNSVGNLHCFPIRVWTPQQNKRKCVVIQLQLPRTPHDARS